MAIISITSQRFLSGLTVFDTYNGLNGTVVAMNLDTAAAPSLAPLYTGAFFLVQYSDATQQVFTTQGKRVDHTTGVALTGITLLTLNEKNALLGAGYPAL